MNLNSIDEYIDNSKIELPSLEGKTFEEVCNSLVNDTERFSQLLCLLCILVEGKYIRLPDEVAETSIRYKKNKQAYLINICLDILKYLNMIEYVKISEKLILAKITNEELANSLSKMKLELKANNEKFSKLSKDIDKELDSNEEYQEIKRKLNV